jgi:arylsulfatase A-like enzyme
MAAATPTFGPVSPQLDALAAGGLRFTQGYSNSPVCSPRALR